MPKKAKNISDSGIKGGIIKKIQFTNSVLFGKNELNFNSGINVIQCKNFIDKAILKLIFKIVLNPDSFIKNKMLNDFDFKLIEIIKQEKKQPVLFKMTLNIISGTISEKYLQLLSNFINKDELIIEFSINLNHEIQLQIFHFSDRKFIPMTPSIEFLISQILKILIWQNKSFYPYINDERIYNITQLEPAQFFDFSLQILGYQQLITEYYSLIERFNLFLAEKENFIHLKKIGDERKLALENDLQVIKEIDEINLKLNEIELEKGWSKYFELKNKFDGKTVNLDQAKIKLETVYAESDTLSNRSDVITEELNGLQNELERISNEYETKRKGFLSEKALLDKIERSLKDWESSISKTEKELRFKKMKLSDKDKKLKDIDARINKDKSDSLIQQKEKLEAEIKKDNLEVQNLQQRLDAVVNEKNIKLKEKSVKEKKSQPMTSDLAFLTSKIAEINDKIAEKEKELYDIKESIENNKSTSEKLSNQQNTLEKEIEKLIQDISLEEEAIKNKKLKKVPQQRSLATLSILENQLLAERSKLLSNIDPESNSETYSKHILLIKDLDSEVSSRDAELDQLENLIADWKKNWDNLLQDGLNKLESYTNKLLEGQLINISIHLSRTTIPNEAGLMLTFLLKDSNINISFPLYDSSSVSNQITFNYILASILLNKRHFYMFDLFDPHPMHEKGLKDFFKLYTDYSLLENSDTILNNQQLIFITNEDIIKNIPLLDNFLTITQE